MTPLIVEARAERANPARVVLRDLIPLPTTTLTRDRHLLIPALAPVQRRVDLLPRRADLLPRRADLLPRRVERVDLDPRPPTLLILDLLIMIPSLARENPARVALRDPTLDPMTLTLDPMTLTLDPMILDLATPKDPRVEAALPTTDQALPTPRDPRVEAALLTTDQALPTPRDPRAETTLLTTDQALLTPRDPRAETTLLTTDQALLMPEAKDQARAKDPDGYR